MASIGSENNGHRRILFVAADGSRKTVRLGKISQRDAEEICRHVEALAAGSINGQPLARNTAMWLKDIGPTLHDRLARAGLVAPREANGAMKLGPSITALLDGRLDLKPATKIVRGQVVRDLKEHFGDNRDVRSISPGQADDFKQWLIGRGLAPTTIHKRLQVARSFFHAMRRRRLIEENPFEGVQMPASGIKDRQRFVSREDIQKVLAACPDRHWRSIVALSRYGGLRCPSEVLSLRWQDINWETGRVTVRSPKTEPFADKASRVIPLFPELRTILMESFTLADDGEEYVVNERFRKAAMGPSGWMNANLRTTLTKVIHRAGLTPWPRLFHNLRASRETELVETFPVQVVTSWLGNTPTVAMRHYLMTTDTHFETAIAAAEIHPNPAQNPAQQALAGSRKVKKVAGTKTKSPANCGAFQELAADCDEPQIYQVAGGGFEPPTSGL